MQLNHRTLTDAEMQTILGRAHALRAEATREIGQAIGAYLKSRFDAVKNSLSRPAHKAA
jgi:hypothetical protein